MAGAGAKRYTLPQFFLDKNDRPVENGSTSEGDFTWGEASKGRSARGAETGEEDGKVTRFADTLRRLRLDHPERLSIREVSRRAGIDVSYLSRMEKGEVPPPSEEIILRLAQVLGADPDSLLEPADRIPPDVREIIRDRYQEIPSFLRTARDLSPEDWNRLTSYVQKNLLRPKVDRKL